MFLTSRKQKRQILTPSQKQEEDFSKKKKPATGTNLVLGYLDLRQSMLSLEMSVKFLILTALLHLQRETTLRMCVAPPLSWEFPLDALQGVPFLGGYFHDRLAASYDAAKGFVVAQDEVKKLVDSLSLSIDDSVQDEDIKSILLKEIDSNRLEALGYIKDMQEKYPDITVSIETKQAVRSILNHEQATIKKMKKQGAIEADEATRMLDDVEERMKSIMDKPLKLKVPTSQEVLREVTWLQGMPTSVIEKIISAAQEKTYQTDDKLMNQGDPVMDSL